MPTPRGLFIACAIGALTSATVAGTMQPRVAIVAASTITADAQNDPRFTDPRDKIMSTGLFSGVDIISVSNAGDSVGTPSLGDLQQYDAVITWSNFSYDDPVAMGNVLADYVDAGGGVVVGLFANTSPNSGRFLEGRWNDPGSEYLAIPQNGGFTVGTTATLVDIPSHPIFDGVNSFINDVGIGMNGPFGAWRPTNTNLTPGSTLIAQYDDGKTLAALAPNPKVVELGFHPVSDVVNDGYWNSGSDGALIMGNALLFAANIPAPGAIVLFAGAGLTTARRRR
ncbi:MAG: hypothetical protein AAGD00_03895 [Planctomycetota bacterium]